MAADLRLRMAMPTSATSRHQMTENAFRKTTPYGEDLLIDIVPLFPVVQQVTLHLLANTRVLRIVPALSNAEGRGAGGRNAARTDPIDLPLDGKQRLRLRLAATAPVGYLNVCSRFSIPMTGSLRRRLRELFREPALVTHPRHCYDS